jgi:DNA-binding MarR family transcriptional regulator
MSLNRPEPAGIGSLATLLAMDRTTLTAAVKPLERRGLLNITIDPGDRRQRHLTLTVDGRRLLAAAVPVWESEHAAIDRQFGKARPARLRADLRVLS